MLFYIYFWALSENQSVRIMNVYTLPTVIKVYLQELRQLKISSFIVVVSLYVFKAKSRKEFQIIKVVN